MRVFCCLNREYVCTYIYTYNILYTYVYLHEARVLQTAQYISRDSSLYTVPRRARISDAKLNDH